MAIYRMFRMQRGENRTQTAHTFVHISHTPGGPRLPISRSHPRTASPRTRVCGLRLRKHSRVKGFSLSVPTVVLNSGGHNCTRYRCRSPFISYNEGNDSDEPRFRGFGGCCRDRCKLLTKHKDHTFRSSSSRRTHSAMSDPWSQTEILRKK